MSGIYGSIGVAPPQNVTFDDDKYRENLQFIASQWNRRLYNVANQQGNETSSSDDQRYVSNYLQNAMYFYGKQSFSDYGFLIKDDLGNQTKFPLFRGMDITKIILHVNGVVRKMISNLPKTINVTAYSKDAISAKKELMNLVKLKAEEKEFFDIIQMETGIGFKPTDKEFDNPEDLQKYLENFQEGMEVAYQNIAKHIIITNHYLSMLPKAGDYISIGGLGMIEVYEHGSQIKWKLIAPESAIIDMSKNDDQHEDDDYAGYISAMSVPDLIDHYEWTEKEIEDLNNMAKSQSMWAQYNTYVGVNGLVWWQMNNGVPKVMVVKGQWRSLEKIDGEWVEVLREGDYIGNKYLRNCKISEGQVWNKFDKSRKRLKFRIVTPNSILGTNMSIVTILKRIQDLKDGFTTKMHELASRAIGKSYVINASKLPEGLTSADVVSQLKQSNVIVLEGADIDEDMTNRRPLVEAVDLTLDPNVKYYIDMIQYYDNVIADIINIPAQARGMNANYQSAVQVNTNLQQSTLGMSWYYDNIMIWIKNLLEYSADYAKLVLPEKEDSDLPLVVGGAMAELFKMEDIKRAQFEDFLLDLRPDDVITEQEKEGLKQFAASLAQAGAMTISEYVKLLQLDDKNQIFNFFEAAEKRKQQLQQQQQEQQMQMQMLQNQQNNATQENMAEINAHAGLIKQQMQQQPEQ